MDAIDPSQGLDVHDLSQDAFLEEVHSFEFWFQAVEGYLSGTSFGHRPADETLPAGAAVDPRG